MKEKWFDLVRFLHRQCMWNDQKSGLVETYLTNLHLMRAAHAVPPGVPIDPPA
jgi:hypothetical protein